MSSFVKSLPASHDAVLDQIDAVMVRSCSASLNGLRAVILTGSVARREASMIRTLDHWTMLGDVEGIVVLDDSQRLPSPEVNSELCARMQRSLAAQGIDTDISLAIVHEDFLSRQPKHIFSYELRNCGRVLWGEPDILRNVSEFVAAELCCEDAWRMLCNRIIELLEYAPELSASGEHFGASLQYRVAKLYLDMATSLLTFLNAYAPTYAARASALASLSAQPQVDVPFPLSDFAQCVSCCTEYKLAPDIRELSPSLMKEVVSYALELWRWELRRLTATDGNSAELVRALAARQTPAQRLRGWLFVVRRQQWFRSWASWPRWALLARRYTPRYAVYLAAFKLLRLLPAINGENTQPGAAEGTSINTLLPVPLPEPACDWLQLSRQVTENYRNFVRDTRA